MARLVDFVGQSALVLVVPWGVLWLAGCRSPEREPYYGSTAPRQWMQYCDARPDETFAKEEQSDEMASVDVDTPEKTSETDIRVKHNRQQ